MSRSAATALSLPRDAATEDCVALERRSRWGPGGVGTDSAWEVEWSGGSGRGLEWWDLSEVRESERRTRPGVETNSAPGCTGAADRRQNGYRAHDGTRPGEPVVRAWGAVVRRLMGEHSPRDVTDTKPGESTQTGGCSRGGMAAVLQPLQRVANALARVSSGRYRSRSGPPRLRKTHRARRRSGNFGSGGNGEAQRRPEDGGGRYNGPPAVW